jgi:ABC-type transport system involved in cytochrome c biogenesis permease subunit
LKPLLENIIYLIILEILILVAGFIITSNSDTDLHFRGIFVLSLTFALVAMLVLVIFFRGQGKEPVSQTMHLLVSLSLKFLVELAIAFIWFFVAKKTGLSSVILFFVLYLAFTLFSVLVVLKTLKYKPL